MSAEIKLVEARNEVLHTKATVNPFDDKDNKIGKNVKKK